MDKPFVYQGITLYNPNDYLHSQQNKNVTPELPKCRIPSKSCSTVTIAPKKKSTPPPPSPQTSKKHKEQTGDKINNVINIKTHTYDQPLKKYVSGKTEDKLLPTSAPIIDNATRHDSRASPGKVHFSVSGSQMLPDEEVDYFDISLLEFPSPPLFAAYLSGHFQEDETEEDMILRLRASKKFGRRILHPNYRLGTLPYQSAPNTKQVLFLFEAAYNSQLEMRLAEIDEAMRGHPPEKKKRLDFKSSPTSSNHKTNAQKNEVIARNARVYSRHSNIISSTLVISRNKSNYSSGDFGDDEEKLELDEIFKASMGNFSDDSDTNNNERSKTDFSKGESFLSIEPSLHPKSEPVNRKESPAHSVFNASLTPSEYNLVEKVKDQRVNRKESPPHSVFKASSTPTKSHLVEKVKDKPIGRKESPAHSVISSSLTPSESNLLEQMDKSKTKPIQHFNLDPSEPSSSNYSSESEYTDSESAFERDNNPNQNHVEDLKKVESSQSSNSDTDFSDESSLPFVDDELANRKESPGHQSFLTPSESNLVEQMDEKSKAIQFFNSNPIESSSSDYSSESEFENDDDNLEQSYVEDLKKTRSSHSLNSNPDAKTGNVFKKYMSEGGMNTNNNLEVGELSIEKKKASVFKSIFGIFTKKNAIGKSENIISPADNARKISFFQKLFRFSSEVATKSSPKDSLLKDKNDALSSGLTLDVNCNDVPRVNSLGPKHTDSVSIMRKKRLKLFAETQIFFQDSINAYRSAILSQGAIPPPLASTSQFPFRFSSPFQSPNQISSSRPLIGVLGFGYKSTVSESVITPAMSRRKRRLHQSLLDGMDENNNILIEEQKGQHSRKQSIQIKGILKNK